MWAIRSFDLILATFCNGMRGIFNKTCSLNIINISHILTDINSIKATGSENVFIYLRCKGASGTIAQISAISDTRPHYNKKHKLTYKKKSIY